MTIGLGRKGEARPMATYPSRDGRRDGIVLGRGGRWEGVTPTPITKSSLRRLL